MGVAPSRETIRRGFFNVNQATSSSGGGGNNKRQDIVLIPLTKEYFPSPDCPLFVQFHKARCDAAVNYYFRRPGNPGDLSCIPNYESSYRLPGEETRAQRRRRRQLAREARELGRGGTHNAAGGSEAAMEEEEDLSEDEDEDDSFPSREALYHGVIEHIEEALFDTDAEMRQAYQWALAHPHTTMGPDGKKQRKVLPVLCAVAFRSDISKVHNLHNVAPGAAAAAAAGGARPPSNAPAGAAAAGAGLPPTSPSSHISSSTIAMNNMQAALENGVYMFGSIINIVGCFGFVSMQEDVADAQRASHQAGSSSAMSPPLLTPGSLIFSPSGNNNNNSNSTGGGGGTYHHDPYSFTSSQASSGSMNLKAAGNAAGSAGTGGPSVTTTSGGTLLSTRGGGKKGTRHLAQIGTASDLMTLPPPVAAPLAAMVFLTKSAGEQNLGRVTHIAASTYYYQMIQAGLIERQTGVRMEGPNVYPSPTNAAAPSPLPPYGSPTGASNNNNNNSASPNVNGVSGSAVPPPMYGNVSSPSSPLPPNSPNAFGPAGAGLNTTQGGPKPFLPPMETFSFSSLLTNIPVLSFLYEMKWRWGYLGVLKGGTPTAGTSRNSSFNGSLSNQPMGASSTARGPGTMMGNHSTGGLAAIDRSVGQGVTDELEMWITVDQMIHGRISKDLAQRLCWSLAERPEVMQERVSQLPSEESGYWRYRGLADSTHLPPIPEPGKVVTIHPKDVYVMGSDVLPGFNEGDILRFDPERLVWFADHSIPLEGLVLAAMRPYCKQAREADPEDPSWVTKVCDAEEAEALHAGEMEGFYPAPAPTAEEAALLASDPNLVHIHEHVGNFYVYKFVRDGTTYYHGTVPNFANPNKKKQVPSAASSAAAAAAAASGSSQGVSTSTAAATGSFHASSNTATNNSSSHHSGEGGGHNTDSAAGTSTHASAKGASGVYGSGGSTNTNANPGTSTSGSKPAVPVPKTIASALFSLLPASRATADAASGGNTAGGGSAATHGGSTNNNNNNNINANNNGNGATNASGNAGPAGTGSATAAPSTTYLATPVTSNAMNTARKWVQALYSYAYGAPTTTAASAGGRRGPTAASLAAGAGRTSTAGAGGVPGASTGAGVGVGGVAGGLPVSRGGTGITPLRAVVGEGSTLNGASYPSTPVQAPHMNLKTPTSGGAAGGAAGFPGTAPAVYDVAVWPTPKLVGPLSPGVSPHGNAGGSGSFSAAMASAGAAGLRSPATPQLAGQHHSRSSSHSLLLQRQAAEDGTGVVQPPLATTTTTKPIKRYVEGGSYEWDWRKQ